MVGTRRSCLLLVEDNDMVRVTLTMMLEDEGFEVTSASSATEALQVIDTGTAFDALVTDIDLGAGPTGVDLADRLHATRPALPIILITGRAASLTRRERRPDEAVLVKPFESAELRRVLAQLMARTGAGSGPGARPAR